MEVISRTLSFHSELDEIRDITGDLQAELGATGLQDGTVTVFVPGSTAAISCVEFEKGLVPIWEKGLNAINENNKLYNLRDTLLPRLISGELRVPDAEHLAREAV